MCYSVCAIILEHIKWDSHTHTQRTPNRGEIMIGMLERKKLKLEVP